MGVVARRRSWRASGTLTLTMPGSWGGGWSALAGRIPVSAQAAGWAAVPSGMARAACANGAGGSGRAAATASSAKAHMDSTVWRWKECHSRT